jgi:hypothetical protein
MKNSCMALLDFTERFFREIESATPPPQWVPWEDKFNWRYREKLPSQILVQKIARQISGLKAADLLLSNGLLQELGVIFRVLDEIQEDVMFLSLGLATGKWSKKHQNYAEHFWSEDDDGPIPQVPRKNIRAFVNRVFSQPDPSTADSVGRTLHQAYSDFVHARSAPTMGMVVGPPPQYELDGIFDGPARRQYIEQMPSYYYRGAISVVTSAKVTLPDTAHQRCFDAFHLLERQHAAILFPGN